MQKGEGNNHFARQNAKKSRKTCVSRKLSVTLHPKSDKNVQNINIQN